MSNISDFQIKNGRLVKYKGSGGDVVIPEGVTVIGETAFAECDGLQSVVIANSVTCIEQHAFGICRELLSVTIPEGVTTIRGNAFGACPKLQGVILPQSLTTLGNGAFSGCWALKEITIPAGVKNYGIDIFDWTKIEKIVVRGEMPEFTKKNIGSIPNPIVEFPDMNLVRREKLPPAMGIGACVKTGMEYACVWRFQSGKAWDDALDRANVEAAEVVKAFGQMLTEEPKLTGAQWKRMCAYLERNTYNLDKTVVSDFLKIVEQTDKKAVSKFTKSAGVARILEAEDTRELHPVEKRVKEILRVSTEYSDVLRQLPEGIRYADSDVVCVPMVPAYVIAEYMKLYDPDSVRFVSAYKTMCQTYRILPEVDEIAAQLDQEQLLEVMQELAFRNGGAYSLPYARYADEAHAAALITQMNKWDNWGMYAATGRKNIIIARSGLLLSDTKAAMLRLDKDQCLKWYARMRGVDESVLRDTVLSDFGFDEEKKIRWDLGKNAVTVTVGEDLQLYLIDEKTGKTVRSVPKKDADPDLYEKAKTEISALKKNVKKVILNRRDTLFRQFLDGERKNAADWKAVYLKNPVLRAVAQLIVWSQEDQTFTLTDSGAVDCRGGEYCIGDGDIGVAHPVQMHPEEVAAWQNYFLTHGLKQPFEQIWEPAYRLEDIHKDRYEGAEISVYKVMGKEAHGIYAYGMVDYTEEYGFELEDCKLENAGNEFRFVRGQDCTLSLGEFSVSRMTRYANHIIYLFDKWTISDRIAQDDASVAGLLHSFTLPQIMEFMKLAEENDAVSVKAILMDHKNRYFPDADPMAVFVLD